MKKKLTKDTSTMKKGDIVEIIRIDDFGNYWFCNKYGYHVWLSADYFEPVNTPPSTPNCRCVMVDVETKPTDKGFNLGKYKTKGGQIVDVKAKCGDWAWCWLADGTMTTHSVVSLTPLAKFDRLTGLPVDTKVTAIADGKVYKRYFSHVSDCGNYVYLYPDGSSSWSCDLDKDNLCKWDNCEVWEGK